MVQSAALLTNISEHVFMRAGSLPTVVVLRSMLGRVVTSVATSLALSDAVSTGVAFRGSLLSDLLSLVM